MLRRTRRRRCTGRRDWSRARESLLFRAETSVLKAVQRLRRDDLRRSVLGLFRWDSAVAVRVLLWMVMICLAFRSLLRANSSLYAFLPTQARELASVAEPFLLLFQSLEVLERVAVVVVGVVVAVSVSVFVVSGVEAHVEGRELVARDVAPVAAGVLPRAAGAAREVLDTIHAQSAAAVAGRKDAVAAREGVHVGLAEGSEGLA